VNSCHERGMVGTGWYYHYQQGLLSAGSQRDTEWWEWAHQETLLIGRGISEPNLKTGVLYMDASSRLPTEKATMGKELARTIQAWGCAGTYNCLCNTIFKFSHCENGTQPNLYKI
jgi:hypothetical protein